MSKTFREPGHNLDGLIAPTGGVVSGRVYRIGGLVVVSSDTVAETLPFTGITGGVHELAAATSQAPAVGDPIYWDATAHQCTTVATGNLLIGACRKAKASAAATVWVKLWSRAAAPVSAITKPVTTAATNSSPYGYATQAQADAVVTAVRALIDMAGLQGMAIPG